MLEHYLEEPADYDWNTYQAKEACLEGLGGCVFSYSSGQAWLDLWDEKKGLIPRAIKVSFKYKGETKEKEFAVNIPISP